MEAGEPFNGRAAVMAAWTPGLAVKGAAGRAAAGATDPAADEAADVTAGVGSEPTSLPRWVIAAGSPCLQMRI